jgi:hypothetical protein
MAAMYFGRRRQAMMAKIAWRNERSTLESVCGMIGARHPGGTGVALYLTLIQERLA